MTVPLYRRVLGARFEMLPPRVRELHDLTGSATWVGRADVERGRSLLSWLAATLLSLPPAGKDLPLRVSFEPVDGREIWTRQFGSRVFLSVQFEAGGLLCEQVGPTRFGFALDISERGLSLRLVGVRFLGVPLPRLLHPTVRTLESECDGRYRFEVESHLPLAGLVVRYAGWLERAGAPSA